MAVRVVTDSTSYLPAEERSRHGIEVVTLFVNFGQESFAEEGLDNEWFYARMTAEKDLPTSSQPSVQSLTDVFSAAVERGEDVCGVFISADMSGTYETARMAADLVGESHPDARIELVDSRSNCMQLGFAALAAARVASEGGTLEEAVLAARVTTARTRFLFVPDTLDYLRRGGRIGGASALLGSLLQIRPVLTVADGHTDVWGKVRTKRRAFDEIIRTLLADGERAGLAEVAVHHIHDEEEGALLAGMVAEATGLEVAVVGIGAVIGLHVGPGTVGAVWRTERDLTEGASS